MPKIETTKKYLLVKRADMIKDLVREGYGVSDIGIIFNIDKSWISRIISSYQPTKKKGMVPESPGKKIN